MLAALLLADGQKSMEEAVKKILGSAFALFFVPSLYGQITVTEPIPANATIDVHAADVGAQTIPRTIFGTFLEPIGNSTYNGLWAELLENPSFESGLWSPERTVQMLHDNPELRTASQLDVPLPWEPLDPRQGNRYEVEYGEAANSWQSLRVLGVPGQPTAIKQRVYLPIHRTLDYVGSFYARHLSGDTGITVSLRMRDQGKVLASVQLKADETSWKKYNFTLHVEPGPLHRLDPADFVVNVQGNERVDLDQFSLMPADAIHGLDPDVVKMAREMKTPLVRFGGNFTSAYHWMDGVGPRDKRINEINIAWGIPEYNSFGTDEFLEFCREIGAQPQIALNLGSGTPQEAAAWVRYVDERWPKHSGLLWELGNELWGNWNLGYPTRQELAGRTAEFSNAVRAVDPSARLIATGADPDNFKEWNATQLTNPPGTFNYLSTHFVVPTGQVMMKDPTPEFIAAAAFALPVELERKLHDAQKQIDNTRGYEGRVHLAFTEWLFVGSPLRDPMFANTGGAIVTGSFLNMLMRNSDIVPVSDMTGIMEFAGIWKNRGQVYASPGYYVFKMFANAPAAKLVSATTDAGSYAVANGVRRLPEIAAVPYLDVTAALSEDGKTLTLFCVNRSLTTDIPTTIRLHDFAAAPTAVIHTLSSPSLADGNNEVSPERVASLDSAESVGPNGWTHTFRHASVTVMSVERK